MTALDVLFWGLLAAGLYPYVLYPPLVWLLGQVVYRPICRDPDFRPKITIVIAAFNEALLIEDTIRNKLEQDYPRDLFDILVISDGSNDGTDEIVKRLAAAEPRIRFLRQEARHGKTAALNAACAHATGELLVFSDANSIYRPDALRILVRNFADPQVGYVTGQMLYSNPDGSLVGDGCTAYMVYENLLRTLETRIGSIAGVDGAIDCIRKRLYRPMNPDQLPDFILSLDVIEQGYRVIYDADAVVVEEALSTDFAEHRMRERVALRGLWAMWDKIVLFNMLRFPLFSWQLTSHKLLRYLSAGPLLTAAVVNWVLLGHGLIYQLAAGAQTLFFLLIFARLLRIRPIADLPLTRYCYYFALLNWSSAAAFLKFIGGHKKVIWQPRTG
jgi:cellulose synthase/poly-beta-1,6-N-acetylglucosamine synthase-like glycosyltransferase